MTIKKFPDGLLSKLKEEARTARRSLTQEVLIRLEYSLAVAQRPEIDTGEIERQTAAWESVAGRWKSDLTVEEEIDQLYGKRSSGRTVDL